MFLMRVIALLALLAIPASLTAQSASLFTQGVDGAQRAPFVGSLGTAEPLQARAASLFGGGQRHSFLAPLPDRPDPAPGQTPSRALSGGGPVAQLRHLIAEAEAGPADYDAVNGGARVKPPKPPSEMTVQEIYAWIDATPGQPHAIGRYQFIPPTLKRLVDKVGASPQSRFSPGFQDRLADELLIEAGLFDFQEGGISRRSYMYRLAKIWAGLPLPSGASYYEGYAGNKATMTWARFDSAMASIFPE